MVNRKKGIAFALVLFFIFSFTNTAISFSLSPSIPASTNDTREKVLVPDGRCIGVTLSTKGVLVVDFLEIKAQNGRLTSPAKEAGVKAGDLIQKFSGEKISTVSELVEKIAASKGKKSPLTISRDGKIIELLIVPQTSKSDGTLKIGAWVKDAASGIGTLTYYDPDTKQFAALGHGICDPETGKVMPAEHGKILNASIVSVNKGEKGIPGELNGLFKENSDVLGEVLQNNSSGIFGTITPSFSPVGKAIPTGKRKDIKVGKIQILSTIEKNNPQMFDAEIIKIMSKVISEQKGFVIRITDQELIQKTGGIVQGMSGSPIIQDGKLIGAVTHVFINDPTRGYGIFIEDMLAQKP